MRRWAQVVVFVALAAPACGPAAADPVQPDTFAFGVFGDGPYYPWEQGRFRRVLDDVERSDVAWLLHVGDILWYPCSDEAFERRRAQLEAIDLPVVYTPGDNEWTDCHEARPGGYDPLDRLASIRRTFFRNPGKSLGGRPMGLETQSSDPAFSEFVENARWTFGGFVFATIHVVGSSNGLDPFAGRTAAHDAEVERRTNAAIQWLDDAFEQAAERSAKGVVLAVHGNVGLEGDDPGTRYGYEAFVANLERRVAGFPGPVLFIHGDSHTQRVDQPLSDGDARPYENFTRLETYGSPDIGWVRVVVDTVAGRVTRYEPRLMRGWW